MATTGPYSLVGIDPGIRGAMVILVCEDASLLDLHSVPFWCLRCREGLIGDSYDIQPGGVCVPLMETHRRCPIEAIHIERVHSVRGQGLVSTFNFGYYYGVLSGAIRGLGFSLQAVHPRSWKAAIRRLTGNGKARGRSDGDEGRRIRLKRLYEEAMRRAETAAACPDGERLGNRKDRQGIFDAVGIAVGGYYLNGRG